MQSLRKYVRNIIKEFAVPSYEDEALPIPGMAYPIEIEDIVVDDVADLILAPEEEQDLVLDDIFGTEPTAELEPFEEPLVLDEPMDSIGDDLMMIDDTSAFPYEEADMLDPMLGNIVFHEPETEKPKSAKGTKMARAKLFRMAKTSQSFHDRIDDDQYLPQWLHDKLAIAEDKLQDAYNYIDYKLHRQEEKTGCVCHEGHVRKFAREWLLR